MMLKKLVHEGCTCPDCGGGRMRQRKPGLRRQLRRALKTIDRDEDRERAEVTSAHCKLVQL